MKVPASKLSYQDAGTYHHCLRHPQMVQLALVEAQH